MVAKTNVYISNGIAYVPKINLIDILLKIFKEKLTEDLNLFNIHRTNSLANDERIKIFLNNLPNSYLGKDYNTNEKELSDK